MAINPSCSLQKCHRPLPWGDDFRKIFQKILIIYILNLNTLFGLIYGIYSA